MSTESTTLSKLTTEIASHLGKELDEPFKRILADKIDAWRSRLLRNSLQDKPLESKFFRQTIYVPLELVSPLTDCAGPLPPICKVLRSTMKIPKALRFGSTIFDYVGSVDGRNPFYETGPGVVGYLQTGKYSKNTVYWGLVNEYLEIMSINNLPKLRLDGVFDKPSEAMEFNCIANPSVNCDFWNEPYPITGDVAQMVVEYILAKDFNRPVTPSNKEVDVNPQNQNHEPDGR